MICRRLGWAFAAVLIFGGHHHVARAQDAKKAIEGARFSEVLGGGGVPLNVVEKGDPSKPAILFIHGFRQSYLSWTAQFESRLAQECHLVAFDLRGHGNSGSPWQAEAYNNGKPWADDVESVIKATGIKAPLIVGWSFGGAIAMDFVRNYPAENLAGVVLTGTTGGMIAQPQPIANQPPRPTLSSDLEANIGAVDASAKLLFGENVDPALVKKFTAAAMRVTPFVDRAMATRAPFTNLDLLPNLQAPITLIIGGKDPVVRPEIAEKLKTLLRHANIVPFPNAGHAPFLDEPERFNEILENLQCK
jgi:pimeloyl-ACP methyl ester carboxylesterase